MQNQCHIDFLKSMADVEHNIDEEIVNRPRRTLFQAYAFIFGKQGVSWRDVIRPDGSGKGNLPELTFDLMIEAAIDEFKKNDTSNGAVEGGFQKCDSFIFNKQNLSKEAKDD